MREENELILEEDEEREQDKLEYDGDDGVPMFESVRVSKKDFSIYELHRKYNNGQLILDPDFQRRNVWKSKQKNELIESVLMGLPLPIFYLKQEDNATYVVVDGRQRLSALFEYLEGGFGLSGLRILTFLNGKKFGDLEGELAVYRTQLEDYQVYSHLILPPTRDQILFDIFDRVNRGGTLLNKQEIRNALYHGRGMDMILDVTSTDEFEKATKLSPEKDKRMRGPYLLTRFFAFYLLRKGRLSKGGRPYEYGGDMDGLLETALRELNLGTEETLSDLEKTAMFALRAAHEVMGEGSFRKRLDGSNPINMNIFETTMYLMTLFMDDGRDVPADALRPRLLEVLEGEQFQSYIGNGRDIVANVRGRFDAMDQLYEEMKHDKGNSH